MKEYVLILMVFGGDGDRGWEIQSYHDTQDECVAAMEELDIHTLEGKGGEAFGALCTVLDDEDE